MLTFLSRYVQFKIYPYEILGNCLGKCKVTRANLNLEPISGLLLYRSLAKSLTEFANLKRENFWAQKITLNFVKLSSK